MYPRTEPDAQGRDGRHAGGRGISRRIDATRGKDICTLDSGYGLAMVFAGVANIAGQILFSQPGSALWS